jgi:hypothetical protein
MDQKTEKNNQITATLDRFEEKKAVFVTDDGQTIIWDIKNLPEDIQAGSVVRLVLSTSKTLEEEREKTAKKMLNEIIKNGQQE